MIDELNRKLSALEKILSAPPWPDRSDLSKSGQLLFDIITAEAKLYTLNIVDEKYNETLKQLGKWSNLCNNFIDQTLINDENKIKTDANHKMIQIFIYYINLFNINWSKIQDKS